MLLVTDARRQPARAPSLLAQDTLEVGDYFDGLPVTGNDVVMRLRFFEFAMHEWQSIRGE